MEEIIHSINKFKINLGIINLHLEVGDIAVRVRALAQNNQLTIQEILGFHDKRQG